MPQQWYWFLAQRYISFGLQQIKLDENAKAHEKSDKVLSGTGSKTHSATKKSWMKICPVTKRELNCCCTATPCLAYVLKSRVVDDVWSHAGKKRVPANRDRTNEDLIYKNRHNCLCSVIRCCTCASVSWLHYSLIWTIYYDARSRDVDFTNQGMGGHFFSISWVKNHRQGWPKCWLSLVAGCYFEPCRNVFHQF